jgi:hypothetical protein
MVALGHLFELNSRTIRPRCIMIFTDQIIKRLVGTPSKEFGKRNKNNLMNRAVT